MHLKTTWRLKLWTSATSIGLSLTGNPLAFVKIPHLARKWASYLFHRRDVVFPINRECNFIHIVRCLPLCFRTQRTGIRLSSPPTWSPLTGCDVHTGVWACTRRASECIVMCDRSWCAWMYLTDTQMKFPQGEINRFQLLLNLKCHLITSVVVCYVTTRHSSQKFYTMYELDCHFRCSSV